MIYTPTKLPGAFIIDPQPIRDEVELLLQGPGPTRDDQRAWRDAGEDTVERLEAMEIQQLTEPLAQVRRSKS